MIKLADIYSYKNGKKKVEFFKLGIFDLLKEKLGFRYTKINKKGYYLKESNGIYEVVGFHKLIDEFEKFINENYTKLELSKEIGYHDFLNAFYEKSPIKNGNYAREYLSENFQLSENNLHLILLKIDRDYSQKCRREKMLAFLTSEGFTETTDKVGNFCKGCPLFYKKVEKDKFLIFNNPFCDKKNKSSTFDLWKINTNSEKDFLEKIQANHTQIILGFSLERDKELYEKEYGFEN